jgi:guanylate kinase
MPAVILYGPPAAGKTTVTKKLTELDGNYRLYQRPKVGTGRTDGYRITTTSHIDALRNTNDIL